MLYQPICSVKIYLTSSCLHKFSDIQTGVFALYISTEYTDILISLWLCCRTVQSNRKSPAHVSVVCLVTICFDTTAISLLSGPVLKSKCKTQVKLVPENNVMNLSSSYIKEELD